MMSVGDQKIKRIFSRRVQWGIAAAFLIGLVGCLGGGTGEPKDFQEAFAELQLGIAELEAGNYKKARTVLQPLVDEGTELGIALNHDINAKDQARYAFVLADSLNQINEWVNTLGIIFSFAIDAGLFAPSQGIDPAALHAMGGSGFIAGTLDSMLTSFSKFFAQSSEILSKIKSNPDFKLEFKELPLKFDVLPIEIMNLRGIHDLGEVNFLDAVYLLVDGFLNFLIATDFTLQIDSKSLPLGYLGDQFTVLFDTEQDAPVVDTISNIVAVIFAQQTKILGLADATVMKNAGTQFKGSFASLGNAIKFILAEEEDQSDHLIARVEEDGQTYLQINIDFGNVIVVDIETLEELRIRVDDDITAIIDNFAAAFEGQAGARVSWARDIVPLISIVTTPLLQSGFVESVIEAVLALTGDGTDVSGLDTFLDSGLINEELIQGVLLGLIGDVMEFDVGFYFNNPRGGIRDWLPFWTLPQAEPVDESGTPITVDSSGDPVSTPILFSTTKECQDAYAEPTTDVDFESCATVFDNVRLMIEFECDDGDENPRNAPVNASGTQEFFCFGNDDYEPVDTDHFLEANWPEIATTAFQNAHGSDVGGLEMWEHLQEMSDLDGAGIADIAPPNSPGEFGLLSDGVESSLGLIGFRDPTLSGILYINLNNADMPSEMDAYLFGPTQFYLATNRSVNALFQQLAQNIIDLIGSL